MVKESFFKDYRSFLSFRPDRYGKATLFENEQLLAGLNCLEVGQSFEKHAHEAKNRFYLILEGRGRAQVGDETSDIAPGTVIWVPSGIAHEIENIGKTRLVLLVGITETRTE